MLQTIQRHLREVTPLWVSGLALLLIILSSKLLPLQDKAYEWAQYMMLGTLFPALVLTIIFLTRFADLTHIRRFLELALAIGGLLISGLFLWRHFSYSALAILLLPALITTAFSYFSAASEMKSSSTPPPPDRKDGVGHTNPSALTLDPIAEPPTPSRPSSIRKTPVADAHEGRPDHLVTRPDERERPVDKISSLLRGRRSEVLVSLFVAVLSWSVSSRLLWWDPFGKWISGSGYTFFIFILSLFLVLINLFHKEASESNAQIKGGWARLIANAAALLIIGIASLSIHHVFREGVALGTFIHWGWFVGPAEVVRQGGWLLWDVPSHYGFLSLLTLAFWPAKSVWQSLYIINSSLLFALASFLFFMLRSLRTGPTNYWFSLTLTLAAVFLLPGTGISPITGPQIWPSQGPFRFGWAYALLAILLWEFCNALKEKPNDKILWVGCLVWVVGTLWSAESAAYCFGLWLPAYALIVWRKATRFYREQGSVAKSIRIAALWLALPILLLLLALGIIVGYYQMILGQVPDWRSFFDFASAFGSIIYVDPVDLNGPVWALFLIFCAVSTAALYFIRNGWALALSLISGTWAFLWTTSSYPIVSGASVGFTCLSHISCTVIVLILYLLARYRVADRWAALIKISFVPFLSVLLTMTFGNGEGLLDIAPEVQIGYQAEIDHLLPRMDEASANLLDSANVQIRDPIIYINHDDSYNLLPARLVSDPSGERRLLFTRAWLPIKPFSTVMGVPPLDDRIKLYISRFTTQTPSSGYLLIRIDLMDAVAWLLDQVKLTHTPTLVGENSEYQLIWFELKNSKN